MRTFNAELSSPRSEARTGLMWSVPAQALSPVLASSQFALADVVPLFRGSLESVHIQEPEVQRHRQLF